MQTAINTDNFHQMENLFQLSVYLDNILFKKCLLEKSLIK